MFGDDEMDEKQKKLIADKRVHAHNHAIKGEGLEVGLTPLGYDENHINGNETPEEREKKAAQVLEDLMLILELQNELNDLLDNISDKIAQYEANQTKLKRLQNAIETGNAMEMQVVLNNDFGIDTQCMTQDQIVSQAYDSGIKLVNEQEHLKQDILNDVAAAENMKNKLGPENSVDVQGKFDEVMEFRKAAAAGNPEQNFFKARAEINMQLRNTGEDNSLIRENRNSFSRNSSMDNARASFASSLDAADPFAKKPFASAGNISDPFNNAANSDPFAPDASPDLEQEYTHEKILPIVPPQGMGL